MNKRPLLDCVAIVGKIPSRYEGEKTYISTGAVSCDHIDYTQAEQVTYENRPSRANLSVSEGDILFAKMQGTKKTLPIDATLAEYLFSTGFYALRADTFLILPEILSHFLSSDQFLTQKDKNCSGATQKALTNTGLEKITIQLPEIKEQQVLAVQLSTIEKITAARHKQLAMMDELVKSRFVELFGDPIINSMKWPKALIGDNCFVTKLAGFEYSKYIHYADSGDVVMVKAQNVKNGRLNHKELSFISKEVSDSLPRSQLAAGDIVMTYVGANIGDVAIVDDEYRYHLAPNVAKIKPNSNIYNPVYFMYMLIFLNSYIVQNSADTAKAALGMERIRKLNVFVPPLPLQQQFADFVSRVDGVKGSVEKSLQELETLKQSLLQQYFS